MSQQKVFSQTEIEQNGATILGRPLSENLSLEQVFGPIQNWLLQLGPYHLLYMPIHDRWLYWDWVHETWQDTGHKAFEVEFFLDGDQVKTRPVSARPAPSHDLAQQTFAQQAVPDLPDAAAPAFEAVEPTAVSPFAFGEPEPAAAPVPQALPFEPEPHAPEPFAAAPEFAAPVAAEPAAAAPFEEFPPASVPDAPALAPVEPFGQPFPAVQPEAFVPPAGEPAGWPVAEPVAAEPAPVIDAPEPQAPESPVPFVDPFAGHTAPVEAARPEPAPAAETPAPAWPEPPAIPVEAAPPLPPVPVAPLPSAPVVPTPVAPTPVVPTPVAQAPVTPPPAEPAPQPVTPLPAAPPVQVQQPITPSPATPPAGSKASTAPFPSSVEEPTPVPKPRRAADEYAATMLYRRPVVWELRVVEGPMAAIVYRLKPLTTVGRSSDNVISLDDPMASRHHARLEWAGENYILIDQGSSNGTFVNEKRLSEPAILQEGDQVLIGQTKFIVQKHEG